MTSLHIYLSFEVMKRSIIKSNHDTTQVHTVGNEGGGGDVFTGIREGGSGHGNGAMEMKTKLGADGMTEIPMSPPPTGTFVHKYFSTIPNMQNSYEVLSKVARKLLFCCVEILA